MRSFGAHLVGFAVALLLAHRLSNQQAALVCRWFGLLGLLVALAWNFERYFFEFDSGLGRVRFSLSSFSRGWRLYVRDTILGVIVVSLALLASVTLSDFPSPFGELIYVVRVGWPTVYYFAYVISDEGLSDHLQHA